MSGFVRGGNSKGLNKRLVVKFLAQNWEKELNSQPCIGMNFVVNSLWIVNDLRIPAV
jgi:hypothetical protein